ncbi:hypothetical protein RJ639_039026 [Escallonia herrerae]|uniref:Uncharacterized protein n=1 Tax=Escallonia herrerae TaxID=1293975 RepID=A0AA88WKA8_9ASTE|nr:hypothetical protein RJ639_039026 [Escallonia herrerae]
MESARLRHSTASQHHITFIHSLQPQGSINCLPWQNPTLGHLLPPTTLLSPTWQTDMKYEWPNGSSFLRLTRWPSVMRGHELEALLLRKRSRGEPKQLQPVQDPDRGCSSVFTILSWFSTGGVSRMELLEIEARVGKTEARRMLAHSEPYDHPVFKFTPSVAARMRQPSFGESGRNLMVNTAGFEFLTSYDGGQDTSIYRLRSMVTQLTLIGSQFRFERDRLSELSV